MAEHRRLKFIKSSSSSPEKDDDGNNNQSRRSSLGKKRTSLSRTDNFRQIIRRKSSAIDRSHDLISHDSDSDIQNPDHSKKAQNLSHLETDSGNSGDNCISNSNDLFENRLGLDIDQTNISNPQVENLSLSDLNDPTEQIKDDCQHEGAGGLVKTHLGIKEGEDTEDDSCAVQEYHLEETQDTEDGMLQQISKVEDRIQYIVKELLSTEESYVTKLGHLVTIKIRTSRLLGEDVAKNMFTNVDVIHTLHHDNFLPQLRERISTWTPGSCIGDIMQKLTPFLKLYTEYVKNFDESSKLVRSWKSRSQPFSKLTVEFASVHNGGLDIGARMIEPVQRVPRYELLLKDYLKRLSEDSADKKDIERALELLSEATRHFEGMMARDARISMLGQLQSSLDGHVNIFSLSRELLKSTDIVMLNAHTNRPEDCSLYLFNDILLITKDHPAASYSVKRTKKVKHLLDLSRVKVTQSKAGDIGPCLSVRTRLAVVDIGFKTLEELSSWEELLRHQLTESTKKKLIRRGTWQDIHHSRKSSLGKTAPTLVPPHTVTVCMVCGAEFTSPKKKKHCAACGMVVCGKCNSNSIKLEYDPTTLNRICDKCCPHLSLSRTISV